MFGLLIFLFPNFALVAGLRVGATASRAWRAGLSPTMSAVEQEGRLKVMIAGGGIGGLCTALVLRNQGHKVHVYEKTSKYRPFGGPIQIASNALESIKRIDNNVYNDILERSTGIGERKNGLKDGISNEWFATFDLFAPARRRGQDSSVVIDRPILQDILLNGIGEACITKGCEVVGYEKHQYHVAGMLSNGTSVEVFHTPSTHQPVPRMLPTSTTLPHHAHTHPHRALQCDLLIGSDGIKSKVREALVPNPTAPVWSGYTCFAAIAKCVPDDIAHVGYKVFLGSRKYFVSVDVGGGRIQWYAFLNLPPNSLSLPSGEEQIAFLRDEFAGWSPEVHQLLNTTAFDEVEQRDLFDRAPGFKWVDGRVCLLGDAVHPMMPNLGQGGGMAIEDALVLGQELRRDVIKSGGPAVTLALGRYQQNRVLRAAAVQASRLLIACRSSGSPRPAPPQQRPRPPPCRCRACRARQAPSSSSTTTPQSSRACGLQRCPILARGR